MSAAPENIDKSPIPAGLDAAVARTAEPPAPPAVFTVRNALDVLHDTSVEPEEVWGGLRLAKGQIQLIIGPSGLGKSRLALNLAVNQILGRPFAGLPTLARPLTWLFYGNENTKFRFRNDLARMCGVLRTDEQALLGKHLWLPVMETPEDFDISFATEENCEKLANTIASVDADVVVMDPWGALIAGDELDDGDVRGTLAMIQKALATRKEPTVAIILSHSRNGVKEMRDAAGAECANYGKNSKAIFSVVRSVWNIRPGQLEASLPLVEFINAKNSDGAEYEPRAVAFNPETHFYALDTTFRHDVLQMAYEDAGSSKKSRKPDPVAKSERAEIDTKDAIERYLDASQLPVPMSTFNAWCEKTFPQLSEASRKDAVKQLRLKNRATLIQRCVKGGGYFIWTTAKVKDYLQKVGPGEYRVVPVVSPKDSKD